MKLRTILRKTNGVGALPFSPARFLIIAAVLHVALTSTVFMLGQNALLPATFDTNGTAVSFAGDGVGHREDAATLAQMLRGVEFMGWINSPYPFHVKLYSLSFAVFGSSLGLNILGAEPVNLICYLGILILVYKLGEETFDAYSGLLAAITVALWPSFLLHTTQLLKDPGFILGMLGIVLVMVVLLTRSHSWLKGLVIGGAGGILVGALWKMRSDLGPVVIASVILGAVALTLRQLQLKRIEASKLVGMGLLLMLTLAIILWLPVYRDSANPRHQYRRAVNQEVLAIDNVAGVRWWQVGRQVGIVRQRFVTMYPDSSSNIDSNVKFTDNEDLMRYLPRAAAIGLFAPFPNMWFRTGTSVGSIGRILGGLETLLMYVVEALAMFGLWRKRRQLSVWLLFSIAAMGTIALGLVVVNIGTLYRIRYVFLILLIILAAGGTRQVFNWLTKRLSPRQKVGA